MRIHCARWYQSMATSSNGSVLRNGDQKGEPPQGDRVLQWLEQRFQQQIECLSRRFEEHFQELADCLDALGVAPNRGRNDDTR